MFSLHSYLKHFLFDFPSLQSFWIEGFFDAVNVFNSTELTRHEERLLRGLRLVGCGLLLTVVVEITIAPVSGGKFSATSGKYGLKLPDQKVQDNGRRLRAQRPSRTGTP